jgi:hypothetical protein
MQQTGYNISFVTPAVQDLFNGKLAQVWTAAYSHVKGKAGSCMTLGNRHSEMWLPAADAPKCDYQQQTIRNVTTSYTRPEM